MSKTNYHLFLTSLIAIEIWETMADLFGLNRITFSSIREAFLWWSNLRQDGRSIPLVTIWCIWKSRNQALFHNRKVIIALIIDFVLALLPSGKNPQNLHSSKKQLHCSLDLDVLPRAYFDGAAANGFCARGIFIIPCVDQSIKIFWNGGKGSNNKAEVMALAGLLYFCDFLGISGLHIFGVSKLIIDHVKSVHHIQNINLLGWLHRISYIWHAHQDYSIQHIQRAYNLDADSLSKSGLSSTEQSWQVQISVGEIQHEIVEFSLPGISSQFFSPNSGKF